MKNIARAFAIEGTPLSAERYGNGHINETYLVRTDRGRDYILQKLNHHVFRDIPALMENIVAVTRHLCKKDPAPRHVLTVIPTCSGQDYLEEAGAFYRVYDFVTGSITLERPETPEDFRQSALAFGWFQNLLSDFPAHTLHETIPQFHDTVNRYRLFHQALKADPLGRAKEVAAEIDFALAHEGEADTMLRLQREGSLPLRVTHNDTKLNNVLFDEETRRPLCVIDLDTVMPGLVGNDFGDSIRFGASTAAEDEQDLSKVRLSLPMYQAYLSGFREACGQSLTPKELETLPMGAKLMTLECGVRFLTDHLSGDVYFRIHREGHNLDRCRTQFQLIREMESHWEEMRVH